ncbi:MAG TPA: rod shape-determining protein RodA [Halanaerobiales bacterium]|nr:rod shape-determining protein RodA [Halanaerobiales bacterium]
MHFEKKLFKNLNLYIPITVILLIVIGMFAISSAVELNKTGSSGSIFLKKQIIAAVLGVITAIVIQFFDYRIFKEYAQLIFGSMIIVLFMTHLYGANIAGGRRWLNLGFISIQPSELAKIALILVLATILDQRKGLNSFKDFILPFGYFLIPFLLIVFENDLGTALVLLVIFVVMLFVAGANKKFMYVFFGGGFFGTIGVIASHIFLGTPLPFLKEYQLNRLIAFVNPSIDPQGIGYNIIQSKIALGSGRLTGKGLFAGTQNQLNFLPEKHTDFIFSVIGEEFGFIGVFIVIILFLLLFWQLFNIAFQAKDRYGKLVVTGIISMFFFHVVENIGMTMGVMPITGIPLPFISYGGTSMVTSIVAIGIALNVNIRKKKLHF